MINCKMVYLPTREQRATSRKVLMIRLAEYRLVSDLSVCHAFIYVDNYLSKLDISKSFSMTRPIVRELKTKKSLILVRTHVIQNVGRKK